MSRLLVWLALIVAVWWLARRPHVKPAATAQRQLPEPLLRCAHCGAHFPAADAVREAGDVYCGEPHRALAQRTGSGR